MDEAYPLGDLCLSEICGCCSRVQDYRVQTLSIETYPLGDLCLSQIWVGLLGFLPRIHTEEVKGGLVGLGCIGVLRFLSMHLHRQTHSQHAAAQIYTLSACSCIDIYTVSMQLHRQTDRHTASIHLQKKKVEKKKKKMIAARQMRLLTLMSMSASLLFSGFRGRPGRLGMLPLDISVVCSGGG